MVGFGVVGLAGDRGQLPGALNVVSVALLAAAAHRGGGVALVAFAAGPGLVLAWLAAVAQPVT